MEAIEKKKCQLPWTHLNVLGFMAPAICMFLLSALDEKDWVSHVVLLTIGMTLHEPAVTGWSTMEICTAIIVIDSRA